MKPTNMRNILHWCKVRIYNKDGVRTSVHNYHYVKNSVRQFPQSFVQNFMKGRDRYQCG